MAALIGHAFSVVTTLDRTVPLIEERLHLAGLSSRCASVRSSGLSVLQLEEEPDIAVKAIVLGGATFVTATVGINIVANFISPAFDFSHVAPQRISWRTGGMISAVGSVLVTPWNWYDNPDAIFWTLGLLGGMIGPLFGILIADYYLIREQTIIVDDLYSLDENGTYYYSMGYNPSAVFSVAVAGVFSLGSVVVPKLFGVVDWLPKYSWFVGMLAGLVICTLVARRNNVAGSAGRPLVLSKLRA